jgi:hypothetical protein
VLLKPTIDPKHFVDPFYRHLDFRTLRRRDFDTHEQLHDILRRGSTTGDAVRRAGMRSSVATIWWGGVVMSLIGFSIGSVGRSEWIGTRRMVCTSR